jgi:hypothetical protein
MITTGPERIQFAARGALPNYQDLSNALPQDVVDAILEAKSRFPRVFLVEVRAPDNYFGSAWHYASVIRPLTKTEGEALMTMRTSDRLVIDRGTVLNRCIVYPKDISVFDNLPAGVLEVIYDAIEALSGWSDVQLLGGIQNVMRMRAGIGSDVAEVGTSLQLAILSVLRGHNIYDLLNMDAYTLMELAAIVEKLTGTELNIVPLNRGSSGETTRRRK